MKTQTIATAMAAMASTAYAGWTDAALFNPPALCDNKCNTQQFSGFNWEDLTSGAFETFGGLQFSGFECADSFSPPSRRNEIVARTTFQDKCITGTASSNVKSAPQISCDVSPDVEAFSITTFQVSVEFDCNLEFHYTMVDGSTCKQTSFCSATGTTIKNTQCGGAKSVVVIFPTVQTGLAIGKESCSIGIHSIGFDCNPSPVTSTKQVSTVRPKTSIPASSSHAAKSSVIASSSYAVQSSSSCLSSSAAHSTSSCTTTFSTAISSHAVPSSPPSSSSLSTKKVLPSSSVSSPPGGYLYDSAPASSSPSAPVSVPAISKPLQTTSVPSVVIATTTSTTSSGPVETAACPPVLPQCLNTWLYITECLDNTDSGCYCPSNDFVNAVYDCLTAYGADNGAIAEAQNYFQGICAPFIPQNPAIVTACPSVSVPVANASIPVTQPIDVPVMTISVYQTVVVPCTTDTTATVTGTPVPISYTTVTISTELTVPQVIFTTPEGTQTGPALVPATAPVSAPAVYLTSTPGVYTAPLPSAYTAPDSPAAYPTPDADSPIPNPDEDAGYTAPSKATSTPKPAKSSNAAVPGTPPTYVTPNTTYPAINGTATISTTATGPAFTGAAVKSGVTVGSVGVAALLALIAL